MNASRVSPTHLVLIVVYITNLHSTSQANKNMLWCLSLAVMLLATAVHGQTFCSTTAGSATYTEVLSGSSTLTLRGLTSNSCPTTPTTSLNPNNPASDSAPTDYQIPAYPRLRTGGTSSGLGSQGGTVGLAFDGAALYSSQLQ